METHLTGRTSYADAAAIQPEQPVTAELANRISTLQMILTDANQDICALRDRTLGAIPRGIAGAKGGAGPANTGQFGEMLSTLDAMIDGANSMRDEARVLNSRI